MGVCSGSRHVCYLVMDDAASVVLGRGVSVAVRYGGEGGREEVMLMLDGVPVTSLPAPEPAKKKRGRKKKVVEEKSEL